MGANRSQEPSQPAPNGGKWRSVNRLTVSTMAPQVVEAEYAVRGKVVEVGDELKKRLEAGETFPFTRVIPCNIGNPHAVKQPAVTFYRQVAAACMYPALAELPDWPEDVKARAKEYIAATGGNGVGAYSDSNGVALIRKQVAAFIEKRDGYPADWESIALTTGASDGIKRVLNVLIGRETDGVMISKPQYPIYSASLTLFKGRIAYYDLDEDSNWTLSKANLEKTYKENEAAGVDMRAICVINPGNPCGAVMNLDDVKGVIEFALEKNLVILADEVYQENVYAEGKKFHSFKKVLRQMQEGDAKFAGVQLFSFHSTSKGIIGECGQRGGYMESINFSPATMAQLKKMAATSLCSNIIGQIFVGLMVSPPKEGEASHPLFKKETEEIFNGLKRRAIMASESLNQIPGISCRPVEGAMYAFPKVTIPPGAQEEAKREKTAPDTFWCLQLVQETGIICVPGSGFGQKEGTFHFRMTILPPDDMLRDMLDRLKDFQAKFMAKYPPETKTASTCLG